jgi:bifunctional non-homologous end joining protein LigD
LLHLNGHDLRSLPLIERKLLLKMLTARVAVANLVFVDGYADGGALIAAAKQLGLEGVVSKRPNAPYRSGRRGEWVQTKCAAWVESQQRSVAGQWVHGRGHPKTLAGRSL